jgi:hypothetical protein
MLGTARRKGRMLYSGSRKPSEVNTPMSANRTLGPLQRAVIVPLLFAGGVAGLAATARADALVVDEMTAAQSSADERPRRGMTMTTVERRWGAPENRSSAVGQPPITRWDYPGFTVFFEYQHVVHAVRRRS